MHIIVRPTLQWSIPAPRKPNEDVRRSQSYRLATVIETATCQPSSTGTDDLRFFPQFEWFPNKGIQDKTAVKRIENTRYVSWLSRWAVLISEINRTGHSPRLSEFIRPSRRSLGYKFSHSEFLIYSPECILNGFSI